ncbi:MAG: hypothetical protein Kow0090_21190 [Myxococcota bacterium]
MKEKDLKKELAEFLRFQGELGLWGIKVEPKKVSSIVAKNPPKPQPTKTPEIEESLLPEPRTQRLESDIPQWKGSPKSREEIERALGGVRAEIGDCARCRLSAGRKHIVFGDGNPKTRIVFVGEGPGEDEDKQGLPFVGRAGKLLDRIISAMGLSRETAYICNVVKCRPPGNRNPLPDEQATCGKFLEKQLEIIEPEMIVALGAIAANYLLGTQMPIGKLRGRFERWRGAKLMPTYHPSFLLRSPEIGRPKVWEDMQKVMAELGLEDPRKKDKGR